MWEQSLDSSEFDVWIGDNWPGDEGLWRFCLLGLGDRRIGYVRVVLNKRTSKPGCGVG